MATRGVLKEQVDWYEATLPLKERRNRGHFSTPPRLVEHILDACGYSSDKNLSQIRVLDPACGSGNFLAEVARRLTSSGTHNNLAQNEIARLIQRNVWGFDPDPISCFLAQMQLSANQCAPSSLHIHQADGLALAWGREPCVDLFLANPPYLAAKNTDLSGYQSAHQRGQADSYLLFLSLGLQIVRPNGWMGLVLPDPVLARSNAVKERARLLQEFTIHHLWHLEGVFAAQVGAVVIIAQKCSPDNTHQIFWMREKWERNVGAQFIAPSNRATPPDEGAIHCAPTVSQSLFLQQPHAEFRYLLSNEQGSLIGQLSAYLNEHPNVQDRFVPLGECVSIRRGEELGRTSQHLVRHDLTSPATLGSTDGCHTNQVWYPVLRGGVDIRPYATAFSEWWIAREAISKPLERYLSPKLLVVKSTDRLQAALDVQGHVALQTLYVLRLHAHEANIDDLYFLLALLNSRLLQKYVHVLHTAYKWVQPQIEQHVLARLPIPSRGVMNHAPTEKQRIIERSKLLMRACGRGISCGYPGPVVEWNENIQSMYEEQERAICALYHTALL